MWTIFINNPYAFMSQVLAQVVGKKGRYHAYLPGAYIWYFVSLASQFSLWSFAVIGLQFGVKAGTGTKIFNRIYPKLPVLTVNFWVRKHLLSTMYWITKGVCIVLCVIALFTLRKYLRGVNTRFALNVVPWFLKEHITHLIFFLLLLQHLNLCFWMKQIQLQ